VAENKDYVANWRKKQNAKGKKKHDVWAYPEIMDKVRELVAKLNKKHEKEKATK